MKKVGQKSVKYFIRSISTLKIKVILIAIRKDAHKYDYMLICIKFRVCDKAMHLIKQTSVRTMKGDMIQFNGKLYCSHFAILYLNVRLN